MRTTHVHRRFGISIAGVITIGGLLMATAGVAAAESRAANRWNHVDASAARSSANGTGSHASVKRHHSFDPRARVIRLHEGFGEDFTFVDVGEPGDSPGDYGVFRDALTHPRSGEVVGTIDVQCIAAYADQCRGSIDLVGRGQITFDGITPLGVDPDVFAITGGTGVFGGAEGTLTVSFPSDDYALLTIRLSR